MLKRTFILSSACIFLLTGSLYAYRPLGTEDAGVAGKGVAQTEISWDYLRWKNDDMEQVLMLVPIYGLTDNLELSVEIPYLLHYPDTGNQETGVGDINIVAKYLIMEGNDVVPAFTVKGVVKLDNGDKDRGLGSGDKDYSAVAVASKTVSRMTVHGMFGYTRIGKKNDENLRDITLYGIAADLAVSEPFHILAELNGNRHSDSTANDDPRNVLAGVTYKVSDHLTLDAAYRWGLSDATPKWSTTIGASITY